jgi:uncharacterized DUF497 family protein
VGVLRFEWDDRKNTQNRRKHGVSFEEAQTVFLDEQALLVADPDHSEHEERFVLLGLSSALRTLVVCHCYRRERDVIRLAGLTGRSESCTRRGGQDEEALRLLQRETQSLCPASEAAGDDSA